jgi:hypothetical protein
LRFIGCRPAQEMTSRLEAAQAHRGWPATLRRGGNGRTALAIAAMWAGVDPQHPPTMLSQPFPAKSPSTAAMSAGVSSYPPKALGRPAFG